MNDSSAIPLARRREPPAGSRGRDSASFPLLPGEAIARRQHIWLSFSILALLVVTLAYAVSVAGMELLPIAAARSRLPEATALIGTVLLFSLYALLKHQQLDRIRLSQERERHEQDAVEMRLTEIGGFFDAASLFGVDLDVVRALRLVCQQLANALHADLVAFLLPNDEGSALEPNAQAGSRSLLAERLRITSEESPILRALRQSRVAVLGPRDFTAARTAEERDLAALGGLVVVRVPPIRTSAALPPGGKARSGVDLGSGVLLVGGATALENETCRTALSLLAENLGSALSRIERDSTSSPAAPAASGATGLAELNRQMEVFLATATHELRAPLSGIVSYAEVLADYFDTLSDEERRGLCSALNQQCKALMGLVDELFDLARLRSGRLTLEAQPTNARELVRSAIDLLAPVAAERGLQLDCQLDEPAPVVLDPIKIRQCILNLLTNAIKFTPQSGTVTVALTSDTDGIRVSVTDTGRGIPPEEIERIFDLFHTGAGRGDAKSLGLGLYLVKSFIELHGGRVWVKSRPGEGSTFAFALPWAPPRSGLELQSHAA